MTTPPTPVRAAERFESMDLLRGVALLGILVMNIQGFAMPMAAYFNPMALGDRGRLDFAIWTASHLLFDQKFMTIFSLLFGAGFVLMTTRAADRGVKPAVYHYRRMLALLVFGLIHAYLIWDGDILVLYAICGAIVYPFRRVRPSILLTIGLLSLVFGSALMISGAQFMPPEAAQEFRDFFSPTPAMLQEENRAFQGGWLEQMPMRTAHALEFQLEDIPLWGLWRAGGLMLIGMALFKWRVVTGERSPGFYARLAAIGFLVGLPLIAFGVVSNNAHEWEALYAFFLGGQFNYWGSLFVAAGWIGLLVTIWQRRAARGLIARLVAVGRTAFSGYILTSIVCTLIFYGHGLGFFGTAGRPAQLAVTLAVWTLLLTVAPLWLARFRFGPLEWLWRTLTYGRINEFPQAFVRGT